MKTSVSMCIWSAQAQSKRCFPLSTKTQKSIEKVCILGPIFRHFWYLFRAFSQKCQKGSRATPQSAKSASKWNPRVPKWSPRVAKWNPRDSQSPKKTAPFPKSAKRDPGPRPKVLKVHQNGTQGCPNGAQGWPNGTPGTPKVPKKQQSVPQVCQTGGPRCHTNAQTHKHTNPQARKHTNHTDKHIHTQASNFKPKVPRPGARRRRRRSGRGSRDDPERL